MKISCRRSVATLAHGYNDGQVFRDTIHGGPAVPSAHCPRCMGCFPSLSLPRFFHLFHRQLHRPAVRPPLAISWRYSNTGTSRPSCRFQQDLEELRSMISCMIEHSWSSSWSSLQHFPPPYRLDHYRQLFINRKPNLGSALFCLSRERGIIPPSCARNGSNQLSDEDDATSRAQVNLKRE